uniref:Protein kinase domain-containing protein n=1 Tax=Ananas comosus var. bracteatus TaxID=296719 RepID=A0A6V7Q1E7_ANACO|nr:unnamed protein product [Ananas comosus var. bracteatus]
MWRKKGDVLSFSGKMFDPCQFNENGDEKVSVNSAAIGGDPEKEPLVIEVPKLPFDELVEKTDDFGSKSLIREESHATVYYAVLENQRRAAIKKLDKPLTHISNAEFLNQLAFASKLKHENFVELLGYYAKGDVFLLAYEFASMGSLHDILHGIKGVHGSKPGPALSWTQRVRIAVDAAKGLEYLHEKFRPPVIHKDVRSSNVLLFRDFRAKIADYNLFNQAPDMNRRLHSTRILGTFTYSAPEYAMMGMMTSKSDVYGFGVVLLELLTGRKPIDHTKPKGEQSLLNWATPQLTSSIGVRKCVDPRLKGAYAPKGVAKLARVAYHCLQHDPDLRPTMSVVVKALQSTDLQETSASETDQRSRR